MESLYSNVFQALPGLVCLLDEGLTIVGSNPDFRETQPDKSDTMRFVDCLNSQLDKDYFLYTVTHLKNPRYIFDEMAFKTVTGLIAVKWTLSKVAGFNHLLLTGIKQEGCLPVSQPHQDSLDAVDAHACPIPYSKQELIHWFNRIPIGMHSVAGDGTILWANRTLLSLLGYEPHEYIGQSLLKFIDNLPLLMAYGIKIREGKHIPSFPYSLKAKDGSTQKFMASIDGNFYADGSFHYTRTFFRYDVNHLVNQAILNDRVNKQTALAAEKDRFLRVMFHEIRTPLHNLSNSFHSVVRQSKLAPTVIDEMSYQIDACTGLVEDLSFSTMFESDQVLHPRPVRMNLRKELESILHHVSLFQEMEMSSKIVKTQKDIDFGIPEVIQVDQALLKALSNLIKNAVKYCTHGGEVSICMTYREKSKTEGDASVPAAAGTLKSGTLSVSIKNTVSEAMDLVLVNKMFQSAYQYSAQQTAVTLPGTPPTTPVNGEETSGVSLFAPIQSPVPSPMPSAATIETRHSSSLQSISLGSDSPHSSICESLVSSEGLGLGLYVAYNIISNLGGLLECSGSESESVFSFNVGVEAVHTLQSVHRLGGSNLSSKVGKPMPAIGIPGEGLVGLRAKTKNWFHAIDSVEGNKHVDCSGLKSELSLTVEHVRGHKPRILVVDDSPICRKVLVKALESNGYDTDTACDGKEAVDKLERPPCLYDAVLMDLRMPIMDGITATRVCKAQAHVRELPIIIVTAELGEEVRRECMEAGASHFISKPAKMDELLQLVSSLLTR